MLRHISLMDDRCAIASTESFEGCMESSIVFDALLAYVEYGELTGREGGEMCEGDTYRPIVTLWTVCRVKEGAQSIEHPSAVDGGLTEVRVLRTIGEVTEPEKYPDDTNSLTLTHEGLIGTLEVDEGLPPEEVGIVRNFRIERSRDDDTFSFFLDVPRLPRIDSMELTPEDDPIFPEELLYRTRIHGIKIIHRPDMCTEAICVSSSDEGHFADRQFFPENFDLIRIPDDGRAVGFVEVTEHFGAEASIRYPDRYGDTDIVVDRHLEVMGELFILARHTTHGGESLIDRKYFELAETYSEISHETFRYFSIKGMVWMFLHEVFSDYALCLPKWCPYADAETLCLIARCDRDLISDDDRFSFQARIPEYFARCIK